MWNEWSCFSTGESLGAKEMPRNEHLAWNVKYGPGTIEARGYANGQMVVTARRETTGTPVKLVMKANRRELNADGEDVAVFAVQVVDAKGRVVPITDNLVTFAVKGPAELIGVGNGDPTSHESDSGQSRRVFGGLCMALVQSSKVPGAVAVQATSPGLTSAEATVTTKLVKLRPQVSSWERPVPRGEGITGLWRPAATGLLSSATNNPMALGRGGDVVFSLQQHGKTVIGEVEETGGGGVFAGSPGGVIEDGKMEGSTISFRAGTTTYTGKATADSIELQRTAQARPRLGTADNSPAPSGPRPSVGPPPPGVDPSFGAGLGRGGGGSRTLVLGRVDR